MKQCEGQMSLADLIAPGANNDEPPILLSEGQAVYKVVRGDVETHIVTDETWTCGEDNRGYRLKRIAGCWDCTWNTQIGKVIFADLRTARRVAEQYLAENEHVLARDIQTTEVIAYRYIYDSYEIINFYSVLKNGDVYFRYGSMYDHIGKKAEIKVFEKDRKKFIQYYGYAELKGYQPKYANMYKCSEHGAWLYATARYNFFE